MARSPHAIGIDDGPFLKGRDPDTLVVGTIMAGPALVEGFLVTRARIDADGVTDRLATWIAGSRFMPALRVVFLQGITIAGLSIVDLPLLAARTALPVIAVARKPPHSSTLPDALRAAGLADRLPLITRAGPGHPFRNVHFEAAGVDPEAARGLLETFAGKSSFPEPLRLAHLVARAITTGESRGRP